jgi:glycosyltransferase involved in cell wall biosynthesis
MHILVIPSAYPSKHSPISSIFFHHQARALKRQGFKVGVIAPILISLRLLPHGLFRFGQGVVFDEEEGIPTYRYLQWAWLSQVKKGNLILWERASRRLFDLYLNRYKKPDLIHAQEAYLAGEFAAKIKREYGIPYILTEHNTMYGRGVVKNWQVPGIKDAFRNASHRVVVSPQLGKTLEMELGSDVCPWTHIPNILDPLFSNTPLVLRNRSGKPFRFLNIALMTEKKGQLDLLKAFSRSFSEIGDVELCLGGDGPLRKELQRLAIELGIEPKVRFLGMLTRKQVLKEMQDCDVFVLPSQYETFGVVLIEALACGKPVLSTACGGPESVVNSSNGLIVPPKDRAALGQGLIDMYLKRDIYDPQKIRQDCLDHYSEEVVSGQLKDLFVKVIQGSGKNLL